MYEEMCAPRENNGVFCSLKVSKDVVYLTVFLNSHNLRLCANKYAKSSGETSLTNSLVSLTRGIGFSNRMQDTIMNEFAAEPEPCRKITEAECVPAGLTAQSCNLLTAAMTAYKYRENSTDETLVRSVIVLDLDVC